VTDPSPEDPMPEINQTISHYRIVEKIGRGGRSEVYQVSDTKLGRNAAIRDLPEGFAKAVDRIVSIEKIPGIFDMAQLHLRINNL
jgi:serine/threonine protein kinase